MAFNVSPGVTVKEIDLTTVVPAVSTTIGGYAGAFNWGPADEIRLISSELELAKTFGTPTEATARSFLVAASFLKYGASLKTVRAVGTGALNATVSSGGLLIKNRDAYDLNYANGEATKGEWAAKCPGTLGNSLKVSLCPSAAAFSGWSVTIGTTTINLAALFPSAPGTSDSAAGAGSSNDEMHIVVIDEDGLWTGAPGTILETFAYVSAASDAVKADGTSNYYKNVVNDTSSYIWWLDHNGTALPNGGDSIALKQDFTPGSSALTSALQSGTDVAPADGDVQSSLALFADAETVDVSLLFTSGDASGSKTLANEIITIAEGRKDCVAFVSPPIETTVSSATPAADVIEWAAGDGGSIVGIPSSSYAVIDSTALKVYDKYNDVYRWIPACGHIAGLCAKTDLNADAWFAPAGVTRGALLGVAKVAFNPNKANRDELFKARVNPIVALPGAGVVLYGDKTALAKPSAFDAINVRRLFIVLEKSIATAAKAQLFEFNDEFTRAAFRNAVEPFLRDVQGRRGVTDFRVVCDETNNTGDVIDRNEFVADIYIKPARAIRGITLNFIATRSGVSFNEITG